MRSILQRGIGNPDPLGIDPGTGENLVTLLEGGDGLGVGCHFGLEDLAGSRQSLGVVDVGVSRDDHLAGGETEIHLANQFQHVRQVVEEPDVDSANSVPPSIR